MGVAWALGLAIPGLAATYTWDAGGGSDPNWTTGANWTNAVLVDAVPAGGDDVTFGTAGSNAAVNAAVSAGLVTLNRAGGFSLIGDGQEAHTLTCTGIAVSAVANFLLSAPLAGSAQVPIRGTTTGGSLTLRGNNAGFSGGFALLNNYYATDNASKMVTVHATNDHVLGSGLTSVGWRDSGRSVYMCGSPLNVRHGALSSGGSIQVNPQGLARLSGAIDSGDSFSVVANGMISGDSTALGGLTRGGNLALANGAVMGHNALDQATANGLGTGADLLFGVGADFTTAVSRNFGYGTPWKGVAVAELTAQRSVTRGTFAIDTTGLSEFVLQGVALPQFTSINSYGLKLTDTAGALSFALAGGSAVPARIRGVVVLDAGTNYSYAAFTKFTASPRATLQITRAGALGGTTTATSRDVDLDSATLSQYTLAVAGGTGTVGALSVAGGSSLYVGRKTAGTPDTLAVDSLARVGAAVLAIDNKNEPLGGQDRVAVTSNSGLMRGSIVDPWIVGIGPRGGSGGDFLVYAASGFTNAASLYTGVFGNGNIVTNPALVPGGILTADSLRLTANVTNAAATIRLGVLSDGSQADRAAILVPDGNQPSVAPAINAGSSELIISAGGSMGGPSKYFNFNGPVTVTNGLTVWGPNNARLYSTSNAIRGQVMVHGTLLIGGGNGVDDSALVTVGPFGTFGVIAPASNTETVASLSGIGTVDIAAGKTNLITGTLAAGNAAYSLTVTSAGTLALGGGATAAFDLDYLDTSTGTPRLIMSSAALQVGAGAKVKLTSLANMPAGAFNRTFVLVQYGSKTGAFAPVVESVPGVAASLVYDDANKLILLDVSQYEDQGTVMIIR